jgi:hypothetical protein
MSEVEVVADLMHLNTSHVIIVALVDAIPAVYVGICRPATVDVASLENIHNLLVSTGKRFANFVLNCRGNSITNGSTRVSFQGDINGHFNNTRGTL